MNKILKCVTCNTYTLQKTHCNKKTISNKPAKYSNKHQKLRIKFKKEAGLI